MTVRISGTNYGKKYPPVGGAAALPRPNPPRAQVAKRANGANGEVMETKDQKSSAGAESKAETPMPRAPSPAAPKAAGPRPHENGNGISNGAKHAPVEAVSNGSHVVSNGGPMVTNGSSLVTRSHPPAWRQSDASAWLAAYEAIQSRTAEAHAVYQQTMAQCHLAFLRAAEQSAVALASLAMGAPAMPLAAPRLSSADDHDALAALPAVQWSAPARAPAPPIARPPAPKAPAPVAVAEAAMAIPAPAPVVRPAPAPVPVPVPMVALEAPRPAPAPAPAAAPSAIPAGMAAFKPIAKPMAMPADGDLKTFLFNVIAEKTGYPVEILNLDQQLESDLGIDSIKRVEILSAFEGQIPDIKDVNLEEVASLSTLRDVVAFMERFSDQLGLAKKKD